MLELDIPIKDWNGYSSKWSSIPEWNVRVSQLYGEKKMIDYTQFGLESHNGLDIAFKHRCPIVAPCDMNVTYIQSAANGYGNLIMADAIIADDKVYRYQLCFAHLDEITAVKGMVKRGDIIGYGGTTGFSTGTHLHFGVREYINGKFNAYNKGWVDPLLFMPHVVWDYRDHKLMEKIDAKLVINNGTGEIAWFYDKYLRTIITTDRAVLMGLYYNHKKDGGASISAEEWDKLPKKSF